MSISKIKNFLKKFIPHKIIIFLWHFPQALLANLIYQFPARNLYVIGVAGSKGKTTTAILLSKILEESGKEVAMFTTALLKIKELEELNKVKFTTPSPFYLQRFIFRAKKMGCKYLVLETTSHALSQFRVFGIPFKAVLITNLVPDHLDYHKTPQNYIITHQKMISRNLEHLILNADDPNSEYFFGLPIKNAKKLFYGIENKKEVFASDIVFNQKETIFNLKIQEEQIKITLPLLGKFNLYNALSAGAGATALSINLSQIKNALENIKQIPGRLEKINCGQDFEVIVDYAHSPDSLKKLFEAVSFLKTGRVITVFGACGERDEKVRPEMGKIIDDNSDIAIITNDDPYNEEPEKIAKQVISGIKNKIFGENFFKILERREAIKKAISLAQKNDIVLILGKGAEQWQVFKDKKIPWDDRKIVKEILQNSKS